MLSEPIETYPQDNFDYDGHIAVFLHTSAVYLEVNESRAETLSNRAWQPSPAILSQEVKYA